MSEVTTQSATNVYESKLKEYYALRKELQNLCKDAFQETILSLFDKHTWVESFSWRQYSPYWNDGDECVFSVHSYNDEILLNGMDLYNYDEEPEEERGTLPENAETVYEEFASALQKFEDDDLQTMFGNHAEVTVTRNGINVESYDHD